MVRALRDLKKLRSSEDEPDAPVYVRDRTPLRKGQMTTLALRDEFRRNPSLPMLLGDDIFIRGIRRDIEQGDYVYQRGDLLFGPGDPAVDIRIDEQAVVMTMAYAKNKGSWPRPAPPPTPPGPTKPPGPDVPPGPDPPPPPPGPGPSPPGSGTDPSPQPPVGPFSAEGVLKDALVQLWEQARAKRVDLIGTLKIRMFDAGDAFRLLGTVGAVPGAQKVVALTGGYETPRGRHVRAGVSRPRPGAEPVKEFLEQQLRGAKSTTVEATFDLSFTEGFADGRRRDRDPHRPLVPLRQRRRPRLGNRGGPTLMALPVVLAHVATPDSAPRYELRVRKHGIADTEYSIRQMPAPTTPHLAAPRRIAGLRGRNLDLVEHSVMRRLARAGVRPRPSAHGARRRDAVREDTALTLGLLFRALAPMRSRENIRAVAAGIEAMEPEEAAYCWGWPCTVDDRVVCSRRCGCC